MKHNRLIQTKNKNNKLIYNIGDRVRNQDSLTKEWGLCGTLEAQRVADDGIISFVGRLQPNFAQNTLRIE